MNVSAVFGERERKQAILERAFELGFDLCRVTSADPPTTGDRFQEWITQGSHGTMAYLERNAAKRLDPSRVLPGARSIICLAVSYSGPDAFGDEVRAESGSIGTIARYARFADYHDILGERLEALTQYVCGFEEGIRSLWYVDTGPILERDLAQRAGLGFIGKHTNLISRSFGNWLLLSEILTTLPLEPDLPERNRCGSCTRCLAACPTGALPKPFRLEATRCISYLTIELKGAIPVELRPLIGRRIFGCDDCLAACPWNRFARLGRLMEPHARQDLSAPELEELLGLEEDEFKRRFRGTPILRAKRRGLLRNVCVALGNVGNETALPALERAAGDPEPLIAEHARWAIDQIRSQNRSDS